MKFLRLYSLLLILVIFQGCGLIPKLTPSEINYYTITGPSKEVKKSNFPSPQVLLIKDTEADTFIKSNKIIFADSSYERGYYRFASWVESPPKKFSTILLLALEESNSFKTVSRSTGSVLGDLQLNTEMIECYHDTSSTLGKGDAVVKIRTELVDLNERTIIDRKEFSAVIPVHSYDASGAVQGIDVAINKIVIEIVNWVSKL